jgi:hypothetical protein
VDHLAQGVETHNGASSHQKPASRKEPREIHWTSKSLYFTFTIQCRFFFGTPSSKLDSSPLVLQAPMPKGFSKRKKEQQQQGIHVMTKVKYFPTTWLKCERSCDRTSSAKKKDIDLQKVAFLHDIRPYTNHLSSLKHPSVVAINLLWEESFSILQNTYPHIGSSPHQGGGRFVNAST